MQQDLAHTVALLTRTPAALDALLRDLPDVWTARNEGGDTFTAFEVVGHLAHCERADWMPRVKMILAAGESQAFAPLDRRAHIAESRGKSLGEVLDDFARLRSENLVELRALHLEGKSLELRGRHPTLGVVTMSQLLATWAAHDMTHLHQISRIMAHQYRDAVGPWGANLGVLQCAGHSA